MGDARRQSKVAASRVSGCMSRNAEAPWKKSAPKNATKTKLTAASKRKAKAKAKQAGRPYPNLVDNMAAAKEQRASQSKQKS